MDAETLASGDGSCSRALASCQTPMKTSFSAFAFRTKQADHSVDQIHGHSARLPPINSSSDRERAARESPWPITRR